MNTLAQDIKLYRAWLLAELAIANAATAGPWKAEILSDDDSCIFDYCFDVKQDDEKDIFGVCSLNRYNKSDKELESTATFIAHARTGYPLVLRAQLATVDGLEKIMREGAGNEVWRATKASSGAEDFISEIITNWKEQQS